MDKIKELLRNRRAAEEKIQEERESGEAWYTKSFEGIASYQERFSEVLAGERIEDVLREKVHGRDPIVFDFMGYGVPLAECNVQHGLALALTDVRPEDLRKKQEGTIQFIPGDVLSKKVWEEVNIWLKQQEEPTFDVILAAPNGGVLAIPKDPDVYYWLVDQFWQRINKEDGIILAEFSTNQFTNVQKWVNTLNKSGISSRIAKANPQSKYSFASTLSIRRTSHNPEKLPSL